MAAASGSVRRLLIVEPDAGLRRDLLQVVRAAGHVPEAAACVEHAMARLRAERFDALLVDLPGAEHLATLARLREAAPASPIVAMWIPNVLFGILGAWLIRHTTLEQGAIDLNRFNPLRFLKRSP